MVGDWACDHFVELFRTVDWFSNSFGHTLRQPHWYASYDDFGGSCPWFDGYGRRDVRPVCFGDGQFAVRCVGCDSGNDHMFGWRLCSMAFVGLTASRRFSVHVCDCCYQPVGFYEHGQGCEHYATIDQIQGGLKLGRVTTAAIYDALR